MFVPTDLLHARSAALSRQAAAAISDRVGSERIDVGLVLGTGLGSLADEAADAVAIPYGEIPHFPAGGVSGHAGRLVVGRVGGKRTAVLQGRVHFYEEGDAEAMRLPLEALAVLGARCILLTNSAGSLDPALAPPATVALSDHINLQGRNPLIGDASDARFVNMVDAYDPALRGDLQRAARACGFDLPEGVYAWFSGPSFETPAEVRAARILGADLVGMSTVPEVIMARRLGLRVAALAMVTNFGAGMKGDEPISHEQTKAVALEGAGRMKALVTRFLVRTTVAMTLLPQEIIRRKRDGHELAEAEIEAFVSGLASGAVTHPQVSAFAMAVYFRGMTMAERIALTRAMTRSGSVLDWRPLDLPGPVLDKHSTGGVGDNVSLMLAPAVAACGGFVPMISGRGLGHTGGTLDKLDSIPGYTDRPGHRGVPPCREGGRLRHHRPDRGSRARRQDRSMRSATSPRRSS